MSYNGKIKTDFCGKQKRSSRKDSHCICLPVTILYSVCKTKNKDDKYYIQIWIWNQNWLWRKEIKEKEQENQQ